MMSRTKICEYCQSGYHSHCSESRAFKYWGFCNCEDSECQKAQWRSFTVKDSIFIKKIIRMRN